jgi:hypothetical protein
VLLKDLTLSLTVVSICAHAAKVVLLVGDSVKDVTMVVGLPAADEPRCCLKLGFLNGPARGALARPPAPPV